MNGIFKNNIYWEQQQKTNEFLICKNAKLCTIFTQT